ncbi:hypothetical protein [Haloglomus halophilum]|uniref:hypothetical protein n=1 Tax=Haloglomus halophilum TaxID=2962672 RepID=UPI0020C94ACF|nr:hypothetical protein [Haloglomus halophilum]
MLCGALTNLLGATMYALSVPGTSVEFPIEPGTGWQRVDTDPACGEDSVPRAPRRERLEDG